MSAIKQCKDLLIKKNVQRFYKAIPSDHVYPKIEDDAFTENECYFRVWITEMYLENSREFYKEYSPMVNAFCRFKYQNKLQEIPIIAGSNQIDGLKGNLSNVIHLNYKLLGPLKYEGGTFEILIGLFGLVSKDYGKELIDVLSDISQLSCQGELQIGLNYANLLKNNIETIFGIEDIQPRIGLHDSFSISVNSPKKFRPFYGIVINSEEDKVDLNKLWVKEGRLLYGDNFNNAKPFKEKDYFLFYIEKLNNHDNFNSISSVDIAWKNSENIMKINGLNKESANKAIEQFKNSIMWINDLTYLDKTMLIETFRTSIKRKLDLIQICPDLLVQKPESRIVESMIINPSMISDETIDINSIAEELSVPFEKGKAVHFDQFENFFIE